MGKNVKKIQNMLTGNHTPTIQVGYGDQESSHHSVGDKWTDSEGYEWIQHNGYREKVRTLPSVGIFTKQCKDCKKNCVHERDIETFKRMDRCFTCQIDFEVYLKSRRIGENGNKWQFWLKLQMLQRWQAIDNEMEDMILHNSEVKYNDKELLNSLANYNQEMTRESIKKTTT
jgi:hypothetical protein|tara:strand:- start:75 stop:590 length:516 start_codon:yes stop_codon:yes gene_type:complete